MMFDIDVGLDVCLYEIMLILMYEDEILCGS